MRDEFSDCSTSLAKPSTGSSNRICRAILMAEPPSLDAGEITDKGSINQRAVLARRAALVEELYAIRRPPRVIAIDKKAEPITWTPRDTPPSSPAPPPGSARPPRRLLPRPAPKSRCSTSISTRAEQLAHKIGGIAIRCDVTSADERDRRADGGARRNTAPRRILVNCAGVGPPKRIVGRDGPMPLADYEKVIAVNLIGTFNMMRLVAADMQQGRAARRRRARRDRLDRLGRGLSRARSARPPMRRPRAASRR